MVSTSTSLQIGSIFILFFASFLGIGLPIIFVKEEMTEILALLNATSAGVMLGLALIHLMPEANEQLESVISDYPASNACVGLGIFMVLSIEQGILVYHNYSKQLKQKKRKKSKAEGREGDDDGEDLTQGLLGNDYESYRSSQNQIELPDEDHHNHQDHRDDHNDDDSSGHNHDHDHSNKQDDGHDHCEHDHDHDHDHDHGHDHHHHQQQQKQEKGKIHQQDSHPHNHHAHQHIDGGLIPPHDHNAMPINDLLEANSFRELVSAYALEISTAIHSIVIGFDLGVLTNYKTIAILTAALAFHQFVEGLGLGSVIKSSQKQLGKTKVITFMMIFSSTVALGIFIGILCKPSSDKTDDDADEPVVQAVIEGCVTSLAAGSLLYISLVEMTSEYFNLEELENKGGMKILMLFLFLLGYGTMNIIGIWV